MLRSVGHCDVPMGQSVIGPNATSSRCPSLMAESVLDVFLLAICRCASSCGDSVSVPLSEILLNIRIHICYSTSCRGRGAPIALDPQV